MKNIMKRISTFFISISFISYSTHASSSGSLSLPANSSQIGATGMEFYSGYQPGTVLMKVNLWGAVARPGIHHIPTKTNLMTLLSYAGGPLSNAVLDDVTIKREQGTKSKRIKVNVEQLLSEATHHKITLEPNDIVHIRTKEPLVSRDTVVLVGIIGTIGSIILTGVIIANTNK